MSSHTLGYAGMPLELSLKESFRTCESCVYDLAILHAKTPHVRFDVSLTSLKCVQRPWKFTPSPWIFFWLPHQHSTDL